MGTNATVFLSLLVRRSHVHCGRRADSGKPVWALSLGAPGRDRRNLTDRVFGNPAPLRGHDRLSPVAHWPVFNVADMAILGAARPWAVFQGIGVQESGERDGKGRRRCPPGGARRSASSSSPSGLVSERVDAAITHVWSPGPGPPIYTQGW